MGSKSKGTAREYQARDILKSQGFYVVRSAGSHGLIDIVAFNHKHVRFIQGKSATIPKAEREAFVNLVVPSNCSKEIWTYKKRKGFMIEFLCGYQDYFGDIFVVFAKKHPKGIQ